MNLFFKSHAVGKDSQTSNREKELRFPKNVLKNFKIHFPITSHWNVDQKRLLSLFQLFKSK